MDTDPKSSKEKDAKNEANEQQKKKLLIPKFAICQLLAESVHSYSYSCKIIAEYAFQGGSSPYVTEVSLFIINYIIIIPSTSIAFFS